MRGNAYKKVAAGETFAMPARLYNDLVDVVLEHRRRAGDLGGNLVPRDTKNGLVRIQNRTGLDLEAGSVLGLGGLAMDAGEGREAFQSVFAGVVPGASHRGRFAILLSPLAKERVGLAAVRDVAVTRVLVPPGGENCLYADIAKGETGYLEASSAGAATILWREGTGTGIQRALVSLGTFPALFPVALEQAGGSQGTSTTPATWTYDIKDPATGAVLATAQNPVVSPHRFQRPGAGWMIPATSGMAFLGGEGAPVLTWINEVADQEAC